MLPYLGQNGQQPWLAIWKGLGVVVCCCVLVWCRGGGDACWWWWLEGGTIDHNGSSRVLRLPLTCAKLFHSTQQGVIGIVSNHANDLTASADKGQHVLGRRVAMGSSPTANEGTVCLVEVGIVEGFPVVHAPPLQRSPVSTPSRKMATILWCWESIASAVLCLLCEEREHHNTQYMHAQVCELWCG